MKFKITKAISEPSPGDSGQNNFPKLAVRPPNKPSESASVFGSSEKRVQVYNVCGDSHDEMGAADLSAWGFGSSFFKTGDIIEANSGKDAVLAVINRANQNAKWGEKGRDYRYSGGYWDGDLNEPVCDPILSEGKIMVWGCYDFFNDLYHYGKHLFFVTTFYLEGGVPYQIVDIYVGSESIFTLPAQPAPVTAEEIISSSGAKDLNTPIYTAYISYSVGVGELIGLGMFPAAPQYGGNMPSPGYAASTIFGLAELSQQVFIQMDSDGPTPPPKSRQRFGFVDEFSERANNPPWKTFIPFSNFTFPIGTIKRGK